MWINATPIQPPDNRKLNGTKVIPAGTTCLKCESAFLVNHLFYFTHVLVLRKLNAKKNKHDSDRILMPMAKNIVQVQLDVLQLWKALAPDS